MLIDGNEQNTTGATLGTITIRKEHLAFLLVGVSTLSMIAAVAIMKFVPQTQPQTFSSSTQPSVSLLSTQTQNLLPPAQLQKPESANTTKTTEIKLEAPLAKKQSKVVQNRFEQDVDATDQDLKALENNGSIQTVIVNRSSVTDNGLLALDKTKVLHLELIGCEKIRTGIAFQQLPYLQVINLNSSGISDAALLHLSKLKMLTELHLHDCNITLNGLQQLAKSQSIRTLYLQKNKFKMEDIRALATKMPWCVFPAYLEAPSFSASDLQQAITEGALQKAPYHPPAKISQLPSSIQSAIFTGMANKLSQQGRHKDSYELHHRASSLSRASGNKKELMQSIVFEAQSLSELKGASSGVPLISEAYPLLLATYDHSTPAFFQLLYGFTDIPLAARDYKTVQKYCDTALQYLHELRPTDEAALSLFTRRKALVTTN